CPECGRKAVPGTFGRPELRRNPHRWVLLAFAIGLLPLVPLGIDFVLHFGDPRHQLSGGLGQIFFLSPCAVVLFAFPLAFLVGERWQRSGAAWPGGLVGLIIATAIATSLLIWLAFL